MTINIYSTDKNGFEKLSNVFNGPIRGPFSDVIGSEKEIFHSVEHLYNYRRALYFKRPTVAEEIRYAKTGWDAIRIANTIVLDKKSDEYLWWDQCNVHILEDYMRMAFEQNPEAAKLLLSTGDNQLTHVSPKGLNLGKWTKVFPEILTRIRESLKIAV